MKTRERIGERLPSYDELMDAAAAVAQAANGGDVALAGGLAMQVWGSRRLTGDLDVVANSDLGYTGPMLSFGGVRTQEHEIDLDVIVRDDEWRGLYEEALTEAVEVSGVPMPVIAPEYLAAMKMVAGRSKDEGDVRYLVLMGDFDRKKAEAIVRRHLGPYAVKEFRAVIDEAAWRKSRGEE